VCPEWKAQQKILWAKVRKETGSGKVRDLLADERCNRAVLDFLSSTDVGRWVPAEAEDAMSVVSELEVRDWVEEQGAGAEGPDVGGEPALFLPAPDFLASTRTACGVGGGTFFCQSPRFFTLPFS
jgi:hypothetical protein